MNRRTEEPQRTDDPRADAEWKADSALGNLAHGADSQVCPSSSSTIRHIYLQVISQGSEVDRSTKAAPLPDGAFKDNDRVIGGEGSRGIKGWTGDGKGAVNPDEYIPKKVEKVAWRDKFSGSEY